MNNSSELTLEITKYKYSESDAPNGARTCPVTLN
jgi:hypothetical protein